MVQMLNIIISGIMLSDAKLNVTLLSDIILNVVISGIMLSDVNLNVFFTEFPYVKCRYEWQHAK